MGEIIALSRQLCDRTSEMHQGVWKKTASGCYEVRGKTLGIVGYGHIGSQVGILAEMFGMRVVFYDVLTKLPLGNNRPCESLQSLLQQSDFVTLHVPATPQTHHLVNASQLALMKQGACLLNLSRGTVVDLDALAHSLRTGHVQGAALDVFPQEPESNGPGFVTPLQGLPNVVLTPHVGGSTAEAQEAIGKEVALSLVKYVNTGATTGAVNFPHVEVPPAPGTHRILNVHRNVPGVLRDINKIVSDLQANIHSQVLRTDEHIGYLMMDLDQDVSKDVKNAVGALNTNIKTRILY
jgi:D-3-phosphoglycerate dehydrogenase